MINNVEPKICPSADDSNDSVGLSEIKKRIFPRLIKHIITKERINPDLWLPMNFRNIIQERNVIDTDKKSGKIRSSNKSSWILNWKKNIKGNKEKRMVCIGNLLNMFFEKFNT